MNIGILSMQHVRNYGSFLQAFALKKILESMGHQCEFIDIEPSPSLPGLERNFPYLLKMAFKRYFRLNTCRHIGSRLKYTRLYRKRFDHEFLPELGINRHEFNKFDAVVIGSDEVFNMNQHSSYGFTTQLYGDLANTEKVISYAGSFGTTTLTIIEKYGVKDRIIGALKKMSSISVRDTNSFEIIKSLLNVEPNINIDPVLLFGYDQYQKLPQEQNYIVIYSYPNRINKKEEIEAIKSFAKNKRKKLISICFYFPWCDETVIPHPFEVLGYFKKADYVITDTFHGCVMSIKYNKKFAALIRESNAQKMTSLLKQFGLDNRACEDIRCIDKTLNPEINYSDVNSKLEEEQRKGFSYLKENL